MLERIFYLLLIMVFILRITRKSLMVFQQNHYRANVYTQWLNKNLLSLFTVEYLALIIVCIGLYIAGIDNWMIALFIFAYGFYKLIKELKHNYIKPLVYTRRVKTQIVFLMMIESLYFVLAFRADLIIGAILLFEIIGWLFVYPMHILDKPIEVLIANNYLNEAKHILRAHHDLKIIGITGSYGKTSTKHVIQSVLEQKYYSYMTPASFNTPMGITKCVRGELKPIHEVFVCEMGASCVGEITELMEFVKPNIGVVTSVGPQHLNTFKSIENITKEKMQAIELLPNDGLGIINIDNEYLKKYKIKNNCKILTVSMKDKQADYYAYDLSYDIKGSSFKVLLHDEEVIFKTRLLGEHNIGNCLIGVAIGDSLGLSVKEIQKGLLNLDYVPHRLELKKFNNFMFIDNAFNSNPVSSKLALKTLKEMPYEHLIITPGFIDLGKDEDRYNYEFGQAIAENADEVYLIGKLQTKHIYNGLRDSNFDMHRVRVYNHFKEAVDDIYKHKDPNQVICLLENDLPDAFSK